MIKLKNFPGYALSHNLDVLGCRYNGAITNNWRKLKPELARGGYKRFCFYRNNKRHRILLHRLLATKFIPNPRNKPFVCHKDDNPLHNCIPQNHCGCEGNLYWGDGKDNYKDALRNGGMNVGEKAPNAKLSRADVDLILELLSTSNITHKRIATLFGVSRSAISSIRGGVNWNHRESER